MRQRGAAWRLRQMALLAVILLAPPPEADAAQQKKFEDQVGAAVRWQLRLDTWKTGQLGLEPLLPQQPNWPEASGSLQVTVREVFDAQDGQTGTSNWIRFDLGIGLGKLLPTLQAKDLILYRDGRLKLGKEGKLLCRHPKKPPFPLGATGLALYGYEIALYPNQLRASIQTDLSTFPGNPRLLRLEGKITVALPLKKMAFLGKLVVGEQVLATVSDAELSADGIKGTLTIPAEESSFPLHALHRVKAEFQLDRGGLTATGDVTFLKVFRKQMALSLGWDGHGSFQSTTDVHLPSLKGQSVVQAGFGPGPGKLYFQARAAAAIHFGPHQHEIHLGVDVGPAKENGGK